MIPRFLEGSTSHHGSIAAPSLEIIQGIPVEETLEMTTSPFYLSNFVHIPGEIAHPATIAKLTEFNSLLFRISANFFNGEINPGYTKLLQLELDTTNPIFLLEKLDFIYKREYLFWYYPDYHHWYTFWYRHIFGEVNPLKTPINSPLEQFDIIPLIPMKIGDLYFSFTNPSLFMLLTLSLVLLFVYFVTKKGDSSVKILSGKEGMMDKIKPNLMKILRPLSPHLPIYKPQLTSTFPISSRISGTFLATIVFFFSLLCLKMAFLCFTYSSFYQFFFYSSKLILISLEITALALSYHLYHGLRHIFSRENRS